MTKGEGFEALRGALTRAMDQDHTLLLVVVDRSGKASTHKLTPHECELCSERQKSGMRRALAAELGDLA